MPTTSIRDALTELITTAWGDGQSASVLASNGLSIDDLVRSRLVPDPNEIIGLSFQEFRFTEEYENATGEAKPDGYDWTLAIRKRGTTLAGINDDDELFALVMAAVEYLRNHNRIRTTLGTFRLRLSTGRVVPSLDMSYESFEIPITLS